MSRRHRRWALWIALAILFGSIGSGALAQEAEYPTVVSPLKSDPDVNGVNLVDGKKIFDLPTIAVPAAPRLTFDRIQNAAPYVSGITTTSGTDFTRNFSVHVGASTSESFNCPNGDCVSVTDSGSTFVGAGSGIYRRAPGGEVFAFNLQHENFLSVNKRYTLYYASSVAYPDGETITYTYDDTGRIASDPFNRVFYRPTRIETNAGYFLTITYQYTGTDVAQAGWGDPAQVTLYAASAPTTPLARLTYSGTTITDLAGRVFTSSASNSMGLLVEQLSGTMRLPTETADQLSVANSSSYPSVPYQPISSVTRDGVVWNYSYTNPRLVHPQNLPQNPSVYIWDGVTVTGPNGYSVFYQMDDQSNLVTEHNVIESRTDALGRTIGYIYEGPSDRLIGISYPEGNSVAIGYDQCGNILAKTTNSKPGSGLASLVETAIYPDPGGGMCNGVQYFRVSSYTDALGRTSNYTYNSAGQLTQELAPANNAGVRRQTNITFANSAAGISRKTLVRVCGGTSCAGNAESRTEYTYWNDTALPLTVTVKDEATNAIRTTTYSYDNAGRVLSIDGPLTGTADAKYFRYDTIGRKTWEIGEAAPTGARLARRVTYRDSDDKVTLVETGTLTSPTDQTLSVEEQTAATYDSRRNPIRELTSSGATTYRVTDRSFLDRGLADCATVRMNLTALPAASATGACTLGTAGTQGSDRITRNLYDSAGQLTTVQKAYGTTLQQNTVGYSYTSNGKQLTVTDANGNKAQYSYDGHDRLTKWAFPSKTTPGAVSTTDYEQYGYDAAGNRTSLRKRDGSTLTYIFDNLNRMLTKVVPARADLTAAQTRDVFTTYDLLGRQTAAKFDSFGGADGVTNAYNGFGEVTSSASAMGTFSKTLTYQYDTAGRRTRVTHPDAQAFTYAYDALARLTNVYEGTTTAIPLDAFTYNDDATLASRSEGTGASSAAYSWDGIGRLTAQSDVIAGTTGNVGWSFTLNPASQIATEARTETSNAYAYGGLVTVNRNYGVNGLNQYTSAGTATLTYDANGNLIGDGANSYTFDIENRLVKAVAGSVTTNLIYDPLGRLYQSDKGTNATTTRFLYDGDALVGEYSSSNSLSARYVHGSSAAADDPLVWYTGTGSSTKRWLHADHLGSIVGVTNSTGSTQYKNAYDEYGLPDSDNQGRFQYTGQAWIPELSLYYYKARMYSAGLGRFLQVDPVGYGDQINLYAYVGNDPENAIDFTGTYTCPQQEQCPDIEKARKEIVQARNVYLKEGAPTGTRINSAAMALGSVLTGLGTMNDGKGPSITIDNKMDDQGDYKEGKIRLNETALRAAGNTLGHGLAHEGTHYMQDQNGFPVSDNASRFAREFPAIVNSVAVDVALRRNSELYRVGMSRGDLKNSIKYKLMQYCRVGTPACQSAVEKQIPWVR